MGKKEVEFKGIVKLEQLLTCLEDLAAGLKKGVICVQKGAECLILTPTDRVQLEVEAQEKKDKTKFKLEMTFKGGLEARDMELNFKLASEPPAPPLEEAGTRETVEKEEPEEKAPDIEPSQHYNR
ncbi:MAG: amphi-Trp domain-containing protein [Thermodesulfobacteriota bacterium]